MDRGTWLSEQFEYEYCHECGGSAGNHEPVRFMGNWFAYCLSAPLDDSNMTEVISELESLGR